jgi:hypothetical protein
VGNHSHKKKGEKLPLGKKKKKDFRKKTRIMKKDVRLVYTLWKTVKK